MGSVRIVTSYAACRFVSCVLRVSSGGRRACRVAVSLTGHGRPHWASLCRSGAGLPRGCEAMRMRPLINVCGAIPLLAALTGTPLAVAAATAPAAAMVAVRYRPAGPAAAPAVTPTMSAVAATSGSNAWAVGGHVILHWNGRAWRRVPSPVRGVRSGLSSVAVSSARNAWAVGETGTGKPLIVRWDGAAWKRVPSPAPPGSVLRGVAVTSARNAWAVGYAHAPRSGDCG